MGIRIVCLVVILSHGVGALEIETSIGSIRGTFDIQEDAGVYKFLGIPYAEAPVGELRFRPPVKKRPLDSPLEAGRTGNVCPQPKEHVTFFNFTDDPDNNFEMSEDCLYMNIYVPAPKEGKLPSKMPVMFYIHSGGWSWGSASHYDGRWLPLNGQVILVTFNYRLGILGFLRTDDGQVINNGFKDQIMAFNWVWENIENFGGDRDSITVFGQSAGGASTVYIQAVPELRGKIRRIMPLAGLPNQPWADYRLLDKVNLTHHVMQASGCHSDYLNCLRAKTIDELSEITMMTTVTSGMLTAWMPSPDNELILPESADLQNKFVQEGLAEVDLLTDMASSEGTSIFYYMAILQGKEIGDEVNFEDIKKHTLLGDIHSRADEILNENFQDEKIIATSVAVDFITEYSALYPMYDLARAHEKASSGGGRYVLLLDHSPDDKRGLFPRPEWQERAVHGDEIPIVFASLMSEEGGTPSANDFKMAKAMVTYITNFVKTGNPNKPTPVKVKWPQFNTKDPHYLYMNKREFHNMRWSFLFQSPEYWDKMLDRVQTTREEHDEL